MEEACRWNVASRKFSEQAHASIFNPAKTISAGWIKSKTGELKERIEMMRQGLDAWHTSGAVMHLPHYLAMFASGMLKGGQIEAGLAAIDNGLAAAERNNEHYYNAELYRIKGELLQKKEDKAGAEMAFEYAIGIAISQGAKSLELRSMLGLCELWQGGSKRVVALERMANVYGWFAEGFDTVDLRESRR